MKKRVRKRLKFLFNLCILLGLVYLGFTGYYWVETKAQEKELNSIIAENERQEKEYNECIAKEYQNDNEVEDKVAELDNYIKNNYPYTSIEYYDLETGLTYTYNENTVYYGASLIKTLDALYIYNKALEDESILDTKLTYTSSYQRGSSLEMAKYSFGEKVTVRNLVKYAITVSDNSAHQMLIDYIGFSKLKAYGNSLGNNYTLIGGDNYGNIDLSDAFNYMVNVNKYINNNGELGEELRNYFDNDYDNFLNLDGVNALHKYGYYAGYFHDIGIMEDDDPYIIVVLTNYGYDNFKTIVNNISKKVNALHEYYHNKRKVACYVEAYQ
ncbi:MAG TPA: serine hydrolase [Bacilli bacterium]|nr:serine hydrolase [Bacilli bacterium]